jgi:hypothetical protein
LRVRLATCLARSLRTYPHARQISVPRVAAGVIGSQRTGAMGRRTCSRSAPRAAEHPHAARALRRA